jgi:small subunit ribosomal protein S6
MTLPAPTYDLVLLLDGQAEEAARAKIVADTRAAIEAQGELLRHDPWGERPLAYPIERHASADYHLFQFHAGTPELLSGLDRTLRITDGILRFRIIKLKPGVPEAPDLRTTGAARPAGSEHGEEQGTPAPAPAAAAPAEPAPPSAPAETAPSSAPADTAPSSAPADTAPSSAPADTAPSSASADTAPSSAAAETVGDPA